MKHFYKTQEIIDFARLQGSQWFAPFNMRYFSCRVHHAVYGGCYFVTSEQYNWKAPRLYTVRKVNQDGRIETIGDFQGYDTRQKAHNAAKRYATREETCTS